MPNAIKYNTSAETLALKKGNFWIGTGDVGKGPTSSTGFYNGITPPSGGYTIYLNKASGGPSIYTVTTEAELTGLTNTLSVSTNLIKNNNGGNFADGTRAPFNYPYPAQTFPTVFDVSNDKPYSGSSTKYALKFPGGVGGAIYSEPSPFTMTVGVVYTFSFWYKQNNSTQSSFSVQNQGGSGDMNGDFIFSVTTNPSQTWQRYSWTFTNVTNKVYFIITPMTNGSEVLMTEFTLTEGSMPGGPGLTTAGNCLNWFGSVPTDKMIFNRDYESIVTSGLTLNLDAGFSPSFATIPSNANSSTVTPWYDLSGTNNNGRLTNGPTYSSTNGGSIVFDGIDDYVPIPNPISNNSDFTINFWMYYLGGNSQVGLISTWNTSWEGVGISISNYNNNNIWSLRSWANNGAGGGMNWGVLNNLKNVWSNITLTFTNSNGTQRGYINGILQNLESYKNNLIHDTTLQIARGGLSNSVQLSNYPSANTRISNLQIHNRVLTAAEVLQNYNTQKGRFGL
jgi:hypothetical protein